MGDSENKSEEIEKNERWFKYYIDRLRNHSTVKPPREGVVYPCPCCGFKTLSERGGYDICPVCFWEDDGQDENDAEVVRGGPNGWLSLSEARANFQDCGASKRHLIKHVRKPRPEEM